MNADTHRAAVPRRDEHMRGARAVGEVVPAQHFRALPAHEIVELYERRDVLRARQPSALRNRCATHSERYGESGEFVAANIGHEVVRHERTVAEHTASYVVGLDGAV